MHSHWTRLARRVVVFLVLVAGVRILSGALSAQAPGQRPSTRDVVNGHEAANNEVLVKFRIPQSPNERAQTAALVDADRDDDLMPGVRVIHSRRFDAATLVNFFAGAPNVEYAEPNYIVYAIAAPNDPSFPSLWGLRNTGQVIGGQAGIPGADIDAVPAWDITTGSTANVVGVVDTGVDYTHPDLAANIWTAPSQFTVNIFGTNKTCPAGSHGFRSIGAVWSCDPLDDNDHGSHTSGTIGAVGNNGLGVAGVNWTASIMGLKFLNSGGAGSTTDAIYTIEFAIQAKNVLGPAANVRILSNSWGGGGFSQALKDEIDKAGANGMLFAAAAGNNGANNDASPFYPASYTSTNIVAVAATDNRDNKASFSNFGATTVDLGAPGVNVLSTTIGNTYSTFSGTSMATPHVAGAGALILSVCALDTLGLKNLILSKVDPIAALSGITVTGGRLNVNNAIASCARPPPPPPIPDPPTGLTATPGNQPVALNWNASAGATSYTIKRGTSSGGPYSNVGTSGTTTFTDTGLTNGLTYYYMVSAGNVSGQSGNSNEAFATPTAPVAPAPPTGLSASAGPGRKKISLQWNGSAGATSYNVKRSTTNGSGYVLVATVTGTSYQNNGLNSGTTYYYVVTAVNAGGESSNSNQASATAQ